MIEHKCKFNDLIVDDFVHERAVNGEYDQVADLTIYCRVCGKEFTEREYIDIKNKWLSGGD